MQGEKGSSLDGEPTRQEPQIKKQQQNSPKWPPDNTLTSPELFTSLQNAHH